MHNPEYEHDHVFRLWVEWFEANPNWVEDLKREFPEHFNEIAQKRRERLRKREGTPYYTGPTHIV
jgi:hypothetical protein